MNTVDISPLVRIIPKDLYMEPLLVGQFLVVDPRVCHGKLTFKGTRVPVEAVLTFLAQGETMDGILESWPEVQCAAVEEAIRLAAAAWPELLRKPVEKAIRQLAAVLDVGFVNAPPVKDLTNPKRKRGLRLALAYASG